MRRSICLTVAVLVGGLLLSSCARDSGSEDAGFHVTSKVVSHEATKDMLVFAPDAEGRWPVIVAFHGIGGTGQDMAEIATRLAREGSVVFAPTYGTDITTREGIDRAAVDAECGYRFARSIAAEYGGDLDQPVTFVGWSLGASAALGIGLTEEIDPTGEFVSCFGQVPRPDIIVAIGLPLRGGQLDLVDTEAWGNKEADIFLLVGEKDTNCPPWETEDAAAEIRSAGYEVNLLMLDGADHFAPVFHDLQDGQFVVVANDPAGEWTVEVILDAIAARQQRT